MKGFITEIVIKADSNRKGERNEENFGDRMQWTVRTRN